jgi:RNA polymerase primary sigma factor/RNA polymerase sigma factor
VGSERKLLDDALDRTSVQYDSWMDDETSFWMDRNHTNGNLQYHLLMQSLQELASNDLKMLENDIFVRIEQLGALKSFTASMTSGATLLDTLTHVSSSHDQSDSSPRDHQIIKLDPETPLDEEQEDTQVVVVPSGKSQERKLRRMRASEKGSRISVGVNLPRPRKSWKASSCQFISEWRSHPGRRSIVCEQSELLETIKVLYYVKQNSYLYW